MKLFLSLILFSSFGFAASQNSDPCEVAKIKKLEMSIASENVANINSTKPENGKAYARKFLKCAGSNCEIASDSKKMNLTHEITAFFKASDELDQVSPSCTKAD
ncbi:MAG: hypothetical protein ACXVAX_12820 [Pseudobdellovibrio sp.]